MHSYCSCRLRIWFCKHHWNADKVLFLIVQGMYMTLNIHIRLPASQVKGWSWQLEEFSTYFALMVRRLSYICTCRLQKMLCGQWRLNLIPSWLQSTIFGNENDLLRMWLLQLIHFIRRQRTSMGEDSWRHTYTSKSGTREADKTNLCAQEGSM